GDVMGEPIDELLMPRQVVDGFVRGVDVGREQSGERLVQDGHRTFPRGVHPLDQLWRAANGRERWIRPCDPLRMVSDSLEQFCDEPRIVQFNLRSLALR